MISVVLDTNVLASGIVTDSNSPGQILNAWRDGKFTLVVSDHIINELKNTLSKPYFQNHLSNTQIDSFVELLENQAVVIPITINVSGVATQPEDDLILAIALSGKVDYLVSGDNPFLKRVGNSYQGIKLITPNKFLEILNK